MRGPSPPAPPTRPISVVPAPAHVASSPRGPASRRSGMSTSLEHVPGADERSSGCEGSRSSSPAEPAFAPDHRGDRLFAWLWPGLVAAWVGILVALLLAGRERRGSIPLWVDVALWTSSITLMAAAGLALTRARGAALAGSALAGAVGIVLGYACRRPTPAPVRGAARGDRRLRGPDGAERRGPRRAAPRYLHLTVRPDGRRVGDGRPAACQQRLDGVPQVGRRNRVLVAGVVDRAVVDQAPVGVERRHLRRPLRSRGAPRRSIDAAS